jgi:hypothetical protein
MNDQIMAGFGKAYKQLCYQAQQHMGVWQTGTKQLPLEAWAFSRQKPKPEKSSFHSFWKPKHCSRSYCSLMKIFKYQFMSSVSCQNYTPPLSFISSSPLPLPPHADVQPADVVTTVQSGSTVVVGITSTARSEKQQRRMGSNDANVVWVWVLQSTTAQLGLPVWIDGSAQEQMNHDLGDRIDLEAKLRGGREGAQREHWGWAREKSELASNWVHRCRLGGSALEARRS